MRQLSRPYLQHARRHLPEGSDPIPNLGVTVPAAVYVGDVSSGSPISIATGVNGLFVKFASCTTTNTDVFMLKGGSSPYFAQIPAGFYYWLLELGFSDSPPPQMGPSGGDPTNGGDYGLFFGCPISNSNTNYWHTENRLVTPGTDDILGVVQSVFDGVIDAAADINDLNVAVTLEDVVSTGASLQAVILSMFKVNAHPASSATIIP